MNLENSLAFFINQGPVFWAATASVGAGGALLITALFVLFRRKLVNQKARFSFLKSHRAKKAAGRTGVANPEIRISDTGYTAATSEASEKEKKRLDEEGLKILLKRLRVTGDFLESVLSKNQTNDFHYSALKTNPDSVDYEFRVGSG